MNAYNKETRTTQFSAFGGWQIAANALYGYAHASPDPPSTVPFRFRELHTIANVHMQSLRHVPSFLRPDHNISLYYLWNSDSPLKEYLNRQWQGDSTTPYFKKWASMAPLYADYGLYLIEHHPGPFIKYYLWPNMIKYYVPTIGFLRYYNLEKDTVDHIAVTWFRWKQNKISNLFKDKRIEITEAFPIIIAIINLLFLLNCICFASLGGFKRCTKYSKQILSWMMVIWLANMMFSILAAPIELRYQLFPVIITFNFLGLLLAFLISESRQENFSKDHTLVEAG